MLSQKFKNIIHLLILSVIILFTADISVKGAITSVVCVPAAPTNMSTGLGYYLAGNTYSFQVTVQDPAATAWGDINYVDITIPTATGNIIVRANAFAGGPSCTGTVTAGNAENAGVSVLGNYNNFTVSYDVRFIWTSENSVWASRNIRADASITSVDFHQVAVNYGVSSQIAVTGLSMDGEASDNRINPWHGGFNVNANQIVYNIPGAADADAVETRVPGEINADPTLFRNGVTTTLTAPLAALTYNIAQGTIPSGIHNFSIRCSMSSPAMTVDTPNSPNVYCDEIQVFNVTYINGGGVYVAPNFYRSVNVPGTQVQVSARLRYNYEGLAVNSVVGDTTIRINDGTNDTDVLIADGTTVGTNVVTLPAGNVLYTYQAVNIIGGAYSSTVNGQNAAGLIDQTPLTTTIYWEDADPPGAGTPFTGLVSDDPGVQSIYIEWDLLLQDAPDYGAALDTFKIYYREVGAPTWIVIDDGTIAALGIYTTTSVTITGLTPMTDYEYQVSAVDVFGYEVAPGDRISGSVSTGPTETTCQVTDGIMTYYDSDFDTDPAPTPNLGLREGAIKVKFRIVTSGNSPDLVDLIVADNASEPVDINTLVEGVSKWTYSCTKTAPNTYQAIIPSTNPLIVVGTECRFILRTTFNSAPSYSDHDIDYDPAEAALPDPNDHEWRFSIIPPPSIPTQPVAILNNVITKKNPRAYPAYQLTDAAKVSIKVYDIKGRVVKTLLDKANRPAGINIKENGWDGTNKAGKKVGKGLYYIHIKAVRRSDKKVILNKFKKVVVAEK